MCQCPTLTRKKPYLYTNIDVFFLIDFLLLVELVEPN